MNNTLKTASALLGNFVEAFVALSSEVADLVVKTLTSPLEDGDSSSSNGASAVDEAAAASSTVGSSSIVSREASTTPASPANLFTETILSSLPQYLQDLASYFVFDDFQLLLLKVFLSILLVNCLLIAIVWNIYGQQITDNFMSDTPAVPPEELKRRITELNLPSAHSQRY